jgi:hypothetical protein
MARCKYNFFVPARYGDCDPSAGLILNYFRYSRAFLFLRLVVFHFWVPLRIHFVNFKVFPLSIIFIWRRLFLLHSTLFVHKLQLNSICVRTQENIVFMLRNVNLCVKRQSEPRSTLTVLALSRNSSCDFKALHVRTQIICAIVQMIGNISFCRK